MMETMIPPQVGMRLWTLKRKKRKKKEKGQKEKKGQRKKKKKERKGNKMREKERRDNATILLPHLCFKIAP